ncbi:Uncharacterised protein [uncultured archaeon]|nr:Uncharacterised protein [uncultured archaeon]
MKRNTFLVLALGCLVWHAQAFDNTCSTAMKEAVSFFNSLPSNAVNAQITSGGIGISSCHAWVVTWGTSCDESSGTQASATQASDTQAAVYKPKPDWRTFPTKYRKPSKASTPTKDGMILK